MTFVFTYNFTLSGGLHSLCGSKLYLIFFFHLNNFNCSCTIGLLIINCFSFHLLFQTSFLKCIFKKFRILGYNFLLIFKKCLSMVLWLVPFLPKSLKVSSHFYLFFFSACNVSISLSDLRFYLGLSAIWLLGVSSMFCDTFFFITFG